MKYNYRDAMVSDIKEYIQDNHLEPEQEETHDHYIERLNDELWDVDEITGNGGMYYASEEECAGYIGYGIQDFLQASLDFGGFPFDKNSIELQLEAPARYVDCLIRCYLLYECVERAVNELGYEFEIE